MGGLFGAVSKKDVVLDTYFGVDYHSHLGTKNAGLAFYDKKKGFQRQIHSIESAPFRSRFEHELKDYCGHIGIGCISDRDAQPLLVKSHLGVYAIATVCAINNEEEIIKNHFTDRGRQFIITSDGAINSTELVAALINQKKDLVSVIRYAQKVVEGSLTILIL